MSSPPSRRDGGPPSQVTPPQKVFVGNLSYFCSQDDLRQLFSPFGFIKSVSVCRTKALEPLYFGFVFFQEEVEADAAVRAMDGHLFQGRKLKVRNTSSSSSESPSQDIQRDDGIQVVFSFISYQLDLVVTEQVLVTIFQEFGEVVDCVIKSYTRHTAPSSPSSTSAHTIAEAHHVERDRMNRQGGYGFVTFPDIDTAQRAVSEPSFVRQVARPSSPTPITFVEIQIDCQLSKGSQILLQEKHDRRLSPGSHREGGGHGGQGPTGRQSPSVVKSSSSEPPFRRAFKHPVSDPSRPQQQPSVESQANDSVRPLQHINDSHRLSASAANSFVSHPSRSVYPSSPSIAKLPEGAGITTAFSHPQFSNPPQSSADSRHLPTSFAQSPLSQTSSSNVTSMPLPPSHHLSTPPVANLPPYSNGAYFPPSHAQPPHGASPYPPSTSSSGGAQFGGYSPYESTGAQLPGYAIPSNAHVMLPAAPTAPDAHFAPYPPSSMSYPTFPPPGYQNWVFPLSYAPSMPNALPGPGYYQQGAAFYPSHYVSPPAFTGHHPATAPFPAPASSVAQHAHVGWQPTTTVSAHDERGRANSSRPQRDHPPMHRKHG